MDSLYEFLELSIYKSTIVQCLPSDSKSCLSKRAQSLECRGLKTHVAMDVLQHDLKGHHTAPANLTESQAALVNIWEVIPVERFQTLIEFMPRRVAAVIKAREGPTRY
ncbi:hypothetical protein TNCV_1837261 [Trichonephila clavipes]|nr:hypothetical protein TNCV_1837261 [Trichonephila clavipes]